MLFGNSELEKCKKKLVHLKQEAEKAESFLEKLERKYESKSWEGYFTGSVKTYAERYEKCLASDKRDEIIAACDKLEKAEAAVDAFIEGEYALAVYKAYCKKKPKLIRISTDEVYDWEMAFGTSFDEVDKGARHAMVALVEEPTKFKFK